MRLYHFKWQLGAAFTVWPLGIFIKRKPFRYDVVVHERYHWADQKAIGLRWYLAYFMLVPLFGMTRKHPMERHAYLAQDEAKKLNPNMERDAS